MLKEKNRFKNNTAVITVMTNIGFKKFAKENNINYEITSVGDRYVLENMLLNDYSIGGEQSGHIIFKDFATTGDGLLTAIQFLSILSKTKEMFS